MTEERGPGREPGAGASTRVATDPVATFPVAIRPLAVVLALAAIHAGTTAALVVFALAVAMKDTDGFVMLWFTHGLVFGIPAAAALATVGWRTEQALVGRRPPGPHLWAAGGVGVALAAHWLPVCVVSPLLGVAGMMESGYRSDRYLEAALIALVAWFGTGAGVFLAALSARAMARRSWAGAAPFSGISRVPTSLAVAAVYAFAVTGPGAVWTALVVKGWQGGEGAGFMVPWIVLGAASAAFAGGATGWWLARAGRASPRAGLGARNRQAEVAGAVLAAHGLVPFVVACVALGGERDLQFVLAVVSGLTVLAGTALWSTGRTLRVEETVRVLP